MLKDNFADVHFSEVQSADFVEGKIAAKNHMVLEAFLCLRKPNVNDEEFVVLIK